MSSSNHLSKENSLYLQQHAHNPVEWYPWSVEALNKAKETHKPILLSIGYSACHWCHVMAHESFEDPETAAIMNQHFINIKVDREERPDLDRIYQTALQLLTGKAGGWPLTIFLTPDHQTPFFGGTYFPKRAGFGMPSFKDLLLKIAAYFREHTDDAQLIGAKVQSQLQKFTEPTIVPDLKIDEELLTIARQQLSTEFDKKNGGFGTAPKFPHPNYLESLLRSWAKNNNAKNNNEDQEALLMAILSLTRMAEGGIYDQLGGGFFRYSTDEAWRIPHFEKMLYDNAQLLPLYANAFIISQNPLFKKTVEETAHWLMQDMHAANGGFYSTLNADSEGVEGKFYCWDRPEIEKILAPEEFNAIEKYFGLDLPPNFENHWHLYVTAPAPEAAQALIKSARQKLLDAREKRIHPDMDKKIITSWNALLIKGLFIAGRRLNRKDYFDAAQAALNFIHANLWKNKRLYANFNNDQAKFIAYLDDYAFLLDALLEGLQSQWSKSILEFAIEIANVLSDYFYDKTNGGFFFTAHDHESLIQRPKPFMDEAIPSGNGVAAYGLLRLGHLLGEQKYLDMAERTLQSAVSVMYQFPLAYTNLLFAVEEYLNPPLFIIICGESEKLFEWQQVYQHLYLPQSFCLAIPKNQADLPLAFATYIPSGEIAAYACQGRQCFATFHSLEEFKNFCNKIA